MRLLLFVGVLLMSVAAQAQPKTEWKLVIHGGAGVIERKTMTAEKERDVRAGLNRALDAGSKILSAGGTALDAVEAAVRVLEDDPNFNAGKGAVYTWEGRNELDASIMDGRTRAAGAVAGVTKTKNPISLARAVMEKSKHVLLIGEGADQFSSEQRLEQVPPSYFGTPERRKQLEELKAKNLSALEVEYKYGTVGAVALDIKGDLAAATSTGGTTGKRWGRVGDSPLIGAGTYADNRACAVSATGAGEYFIRVGVAHEICTRARFDRDYELESSLVSPPRAAPSADYGAHADAVMAEVKALGGDGGVIVLSPEGHVVYSFNTPGMYRGNASKSGRSVAIYGDEGER